MTRSVQDSIAIVGMACRFPGAPSISALWNNLENGVESITHYSRDALLQAGISKELLDDPRYVKSAPVLDGVDLFDAHWFNISPSEAEIMDPQHRLFLECAWECLENAGHNSDQGKQRTGVYGGAGPGTYFLEAFDSRAFGAADSITKIVTGNDKDYLTTRVSYKLGLTGPSICVQSACSTSLVAVHVACRSLIDCQVDLALAGAVSIRLPQQSGYLYEEGGILSPDGHCRAFDADAAGTVFGSGVGVVALKRLEDAMADRDTIYAVIRASAVNNDGSVKAGFTAPSPDLQAEVIAEAMAVANVDPRTITYVEAHGTGTTLGDPIEISALTKAFQGWTREKQFCALGSIKTNIGHMDTAAGVAGLIKTVLALQHRRIPAHLHFCHPNPRIDFENSPFYLCSRLQEWKTEKSPRRAGVSSFGMGGTNCHVVLEEAPPVQHHGGSPRRFQLIPLSAKNDTALEQIYSSIKEHLTSSEEARLEDVAFTCQVGRKTFPHRSVILAERSGIPVSDPFSTERASVLTAYEEALVSPVAFLFPGQGCQFPNMGLELYQAEPVFRDYIEAAAQILKTESGHDLRSILFPGKFGGVPGAIRHTSVLQPALFAIEYALAQVWLSWHILPKSMIGHSLGEYVAAVLADVMSFQDALRLIARRGALIGSLPEGEMLAVSLNEEALLGFLGSELSIAATNGPQRTVVSGPAKAIAELMASLSSRSISSQRLATSHAFHSAMMDPILERFRSEVRTVPLRPPRIPFISNVTGTWISAEEAASPEYWVKHLRCPVRFYEGLKTLAADDNPVLLEVGPGRVLSGLAKSAFRGMDPPKSLASLPELTDGATEKHLHRTLGELWLAGVPVGWIEYQKGRDCGRVPVPGYAFQRQRYWRSASSKKVSTTPPDAKAAEQETQTKLLVPTWQKKHRPVSTRSQKLSDQPFFIVFSDDAPISKHIADRLRNSVENVVTVHSGKAYEQVDKSSCVLNIAREEDFARLFADCAPKIKNGLHIIHLLNVEVNSESDTDCSWDKSFYSLMWIARAAEARFPSQPIELTIVSAECHLITGSESLKPERALLTGPFKAIPREYPSMRCRWIDVESAESDSASAAAYADQVMEEIAGGPALACGYRGGKRFEKLFVEMTIPQNTKAAPILKDGGVYLITGGLGGVGLKLASFLARECRARLILIGRSPVPHRSEWEAIAQDAARTDTLKQRIQSLLELETLGANVLPLSADVTNAEQLRTALQTAEGNFGKVDGVVHAAGIAGAGLIASKTREQMDEVLRPKVRGAQSLAEVFANYPLDFLVCCSSLQSIFGDYGQADYCAANAFLDAFAHACKRKPLPPWVTVNWDTWIDTGMAAKAATQNNNKQDFSRRGISSTECISRFAQLLPLTLAQVLVCAPDTCQQVQEDSSKEDNRLLATGTREGRGLARHTRPELFTPFAEPRTQVERSIARIWEQVLGIEGVGLDDNLFELGGDSVGAIQISQALQEATGASVTPARVFTATTVRSLAQLVAGKEPESPASLIDRQSRGERRRASRMRA